MQDQLAGTSAAPGGVAGGHPGHRALSPADRHKEHRKRLRKERKLANSAHLPLDGWQRISILVDLVDEQRTLVELCDHKARFALVVVGAVNAVLVVLAMYVIQVLRPRTATTPHVIASSGAKHGSARSVPTWPCSRTPWPT